MSTPTVQALLTPVSGGSLNIFGNGNVSGNLTVGGNETVSGTLTVASAAAVNSLAVTLNETVGGTLNVTGATALHANLAVTGTATLMGTLALGANTLASPLWNIQTAGGTITNGQLTTISSVGAQIIATPGNGKVIIINKFVLKYNYDGSNQLTNCHTMTLQWGSQANAGGNVMNWPFPTTWLQFAQSVIGDVTPSNEPTNISGYSGVANTPVYLSMATGDPTMNGSTATLSWQCLYTVVTI